ncbi:general vesicular transport factor p115 [Bradysia coprophila]|uniref:general vesicular transport factor p115 n=1 Tax=Bradysia coprophila TaxID=38358 RepID=UPI00187D850D|nr:general vesicular transport factor p115 [Bradysia coprophila]
MDFLKSGLKSVLGAPEPEEQQSGAETVERLVDRVATATLLDDRRDACRALKALSRKYRIEVGAQGMPALLQVLQMDKADCEIIGYALDTLCNVTSQEQFDEEADNPTVTVNVGEQFTEMFIKSQENVTVVLDFLEEFEFKVRWPAIKLLTGLLANKHKEIQEIVLVSPMAVSKLMDLLIDSREVIRNDALLLLIQLTKGNANIQKIVAFESAFDRLFDVIREEGGTDGGIVVEDCLILMLNLLRNNSSNQQFFKEGSYIQRLAPMFIMPPEIDEVGLSPQKVSNMHCMLQIVRALVSPSNSQVNISSCQKTMRTCGLLEAMCNILMGSGVPAEILSETINCVGEVIRGDMTNQEYFGSIMAPSNPPRPAIVVLLMSMVNEKQPLALRCSVLYCFECFLYRNEIGQTNLIQTLLPSSSDVSTLTAGQLLCGGLFSTDSLANWFASVSLMHGLIENPVQKEQLLRVLLATSVNSSPISLLQQCTTLLQQGNYKFQSKIGLLMLLSTWQCHCQLAVKAFLSAPGSIAYLIAQISANEHDENEFLVQGLCAFLMGICIQFNDNSVTNYKREDLCQLLVKRIGLELYNKKLGEVSKHESYSRAAKQPQINIKNAGDLMLDFEFCKLFKALEAVIVKTVSGIGKEPNLTELSHEASGLVGQYKDIIREQDYKLQTLQDSIKISRDEVEALKIQLAEAQQTNSQLYDQNVLLKAQLSATTGGHHQNNNTEKLRKDSISQNTQISFYESENSRLVKEVDLLNSKLNEALEMTEQSLHLSEMGRLRKDQEDLMELLTDQESKINKYRARLVELGHSVTDDDSDEE